MASRQFFLHLVLGCVPILLANLRLPFLHVQKVVEQIHFQQIGQQKAIVTLHQLGGNLSLADLPKQPYGFVVGLREHGDAAARSLRAANFVYQRIGKAA